MSNLSNRRSRSESFGMALHLSACRMCSRRGNHSEVTDDRGFCRDNLDGDNHEPSLSASRERERLYHGPRADTVSLWHMYKPLLYCCACWGHTLKTIEPADDRAETADLPGIIKWASTSRARWPYRGRNGGHGEFFAWSRWGQHFRLDSS